MILKQAIIDSACKFEHRSINGSKDIYHLEAFVVEFLAMNQEYIATGKVETFDLAWFLIRSNVFFILIS